MMVIIMKMVNLEDPLNERVAEGAAPDPHDFSFSAWPCRFIVGSHENVLNDFRDGVVVCTLQPACREFAAIIALPRRQASRVLLTNIF